MATKKIKELKKGDFFRLSDTPNAKTYIRGDYEKSLKKYSCIDFFDTNAETFKPGNKVVFVDFTF